MRRCQSVLAVLVVMASAACGDGGSAVTTAAAPSTEAAAETSGASTAPGTTVVPAASGEASAGTLLLLSDDFQDGDATGWDIDEGWYVLGLGTAYALAASGEAWTWWTAGEAWEAPYALRASFRIDSGGLAVSLAVSAEGRYVVHLHEEGTDLLLERPWGTFTGLGSGEAVEPGVWHLLAAGFDGDRIQMYVDGEPWAAGSIPDPLSGGSVGFGALDGSVAAFDNVWVTVLAGGLPPFPAGVEAQPEAPAGPAPPPIVEQPPAAGPEPGQEEPAGEPDLRVQSLAFGSPSLEQGVEVTVSMWVVNEGGVISGPCEVAWEAMGSTCAAAVPALDPGGGASATCVAPGLPSGLHTWTVHVDHDGRVAESDEGDNAFSGIIEVRAEAPVLVNLAVGASVIPPLRTGEEFIFEVGVVDANGTGFGGEFTVRVTVDGSLACSRDMPVGATASCRMPGLAEGTHLLEVIVDPENEILEAREDDNRAGTEIRVPSG